MFCDIGNKLKKIAVIAATLGIIASVIWGVVVIFSGSLLLGLLIIGLGALVSWLSSTTLYGFGQLIDFTEDNKLYLKKITEMMEAQQKKAAQEGSAEKEATSAHSADGWICKKCGTGNELYRSFCKSCSFEKWN